MRDGFYIASSEKKEGGEEDDIDRLEKDIPQGHMEIVFLGERLPSVYDEVDVDRN